MKDDPHFAICLAPCDGSAMLPAAAPQQGAEKDGHAVAPTPAAEAGLPLPRINADQQAPRSGLSRAGRLRHGHGGSPAPSGRSQPVLRRPSPALSTGSAPRG